jgi:uncharacterized protein (DUF952 family)
MSDQRTRVRRARGRTLHLTPEEVWTRHEGASEYRPEHYEDDGFIHCTDGEALVIEVGNRYYHGDARPYVLLQVDLSRVKAEAIYEDDVGTYPHIYGPINREAVVSVRRIQRTADGTFTSIGEIRPS